MILIADSGSTKCDWAVINSKGERFGVRETQGINPYFHSEKVIEEVLLANEGLKKIAADVTHVFFYGAGSSSPEMCSIVHRGLKSVFSNADIVVDHDLLGSAMATFDGEPCITCILGTGSNSCFFDGLSVYEEVPSLAYILGDEASGSYFGKILLREYFYKKLPADLLLDFEKAYSPSKDEILNHIYREPNANVYLAGFMKFVGDHSKHPHVKNWVTEGMIHFIDIHVKCFSNWKNVPIHFVGSIGFYFEDSLKEAAKQTGIRLGRIIQRPIDGLVEYHVKFKLPQLLNG